MQTELIKTMCLKKICGEQLTVKQRDSYQQECDSEVVGSQHRNLGFNADNLLSAERLK